jgi:hypothetical protein
LPGPILSCEGPKKMILLTTILCAVIYAPVCSQGCFVCKLFARVGFNKISRLSPKKGVFRGFESHPLRHLPKAGAGSILKRCAEHALAESIPYAERCPSWLKEHDWKSCVSFIAAPRVRIPLSPPFLRPDFKKPTIIVIP